MVLRTDYLCQTLRTSKESRSDKKGVQHHHDTRNKSLRLTRCRTPRQRIYFRMNTGGYIPARTATCIGRFRLKHRKGAQNNTHVRFKRIGAQSHLHLSGCIRRCQDPRFEVPPTASPASFNLSPPTAATPEHHRHNIIVHIMPTMTVMMMMMVITIKIIIIIIIIIINIMIITINIIIIIITVITSNRSESSQSSYYCYYFYK